MEFKNTKLSNGLEVIAEINNKTRSSALGFFVMTGGRDDSVSGISHFLEHMVFKGTKKRSALEVSYELGNLGVQANAYTSPENTVYYGTLLSDYFPAYQELLSDMLRPSLVQEEFDTEKNVILEEVALYKDKPGFFLDELARATYFKNHPLSISVLGTTETVSSITRDQMQDYFNLRYSPSNIILCASGNINWDQYIENAEKYCGNWINFSSDRIQKDYINPVEKKVFTKANLNQNYLYIFSKGLPYNSERNYVMNLLTTILGDQTNSRLYWELVEHGLVDFADCDHEAYTDCGVFTVSACTDTSNLEIVKNKIYSILDQIDQIKDKELESAKAKLALRLVSSGESTPGRMFSVGLTWLNKREYITIHQLIEKINAVSLDEIIALAREIKSNRFSEYLLKSDD